MPTLACNASVYDVIRTMDTNETNLKGTAIHYIEEKANISMANITKINMETFYFEDCRYTSFGITWYVSK